MSSPQASAPFLANAEARDRSHTSLNSPLPYSQTHKIVNHREFLCCIALHSGLIASHIALLVVVVNHYEHSITFSYDQFSNIWLPQIVTVVSQLIGTVRELLQSFFYLKTMFLMVD